MENTEKERLIKLLIKEMHENARIMARLDEDYNSAYYSGKVDATKLIAEMLYGEEWVKENLK